MKKDNGKMTSSQVAIGGVFSGLCVAIMFLTAMIPFGTYALPCLAGAMLVAVVIENGRKVAWLVYISTSLLSLLIVPDKEAVLVFIVFLGYYPIIKSNIEKIRLRSVEYLVKLALFNITILGGYYVVANVFGFTEILADLGTTGTTAVLVLVIAANVVFILYDIALTQYCFLYVYRIREALIRRK